MGAKGLDQAAIGALASAGSGPGTIDGKSIESLPGLGMLKESRYQLFVSGYMAGAWPNVPSDEA